MFMKVFNPMVTLGDAMIGRSVIHASDSDDFTCRIPMDRIAVNRIFHTKSLF